MIATLPPNRVRLNVGGRIFETTQDTLNAHPDALLARMFDPSNAALLQPDPSDHSVFIDRSSDLFAPILQFYRTGELDAPPGTRIETLKRELDFYGLLEAVEAAGGIQDGTSGETSNGQMGRNGRAPANQLLLMPSKAEREIWIQDLAHHAVAIMHRAFVRNVTSFDMCVYAGGTYSNVPDFLLDSPEDAALWNDFAGVISQSRLFNGHVDTIFNQALLHWFPFRDIHEPVPAGRRSLVEKLKLNDGSPWMAIKVKPLCAAAEIGSNGVNFEGEETGMQDSAGTNSRKAVRTLRALVS
ncbi:hypothetical protein HDV00_008747 [Rhizophlyctis rosea]|nr:hypothetical protein HDV00_008747 [Rhizophlyctis rosea]